MESSWRDAKKPLWLLGLVVPTSPFIAWGLASATGSGIGWWAGPIIVFGLIPLLDLLVGEDRVNAPEEAVAALEASTFYRWCTYLFLPLQYVGLVTAVWLVSRGTLAVWELVGLALTMGVVSGVAINTGHELGHKAPELERRLARLALAPSGYGHFYVEHNRGHHRRVATPEDPASSRFGEVFWTFLPRSVVGGVRSAWHLEASRLQRRQQSVWSWRNENLSAWALTVVLFVALLAVWPSWTVAAFLLVQMVVGFSLLEVVNYLEHYGLQRQMRDNGRYEKTTPRHSWNSNHTASNVLLYHLQRHSDHHANPSRRFQSLRHFEESPQLPSGYAGMILLALVPPLWRRVMDPKVIAHYEGDLTKVNRGELAAAA